MSKITSTTPWSTILKPSASMPKNFYKDRGIFLGFTKDGKNVRVITKGTATPSIYATEFWQVDERYMSDREQIAELMGRIAESNEPTDVDTYRNAIDTIKKRIQSS